MAAKLKAINVYRPKIIAGRTARNKEIIDLIASRTGLNKGDINFVLSELSEAVIFFNKSGRGIKLNGLGTYLPNVKLNGSFDISHRLDKEIKNAINAPGTFMGEIQNKENIGKTSDELVALWNADNPADQVA